MSGPDLKIELDDDVCFETSRAVKQTCDRATGRCRRYLGRIGVK